MPKRSIEISVVNGIVTKTVEQVKMDNCIDDNNKKHAAHNKLYDTKDSWPGRRVLKASLADFIKSK